MTEQQPPEQYDEQEAVRRLLADARVEEPMPDDVAARMDAVLAGLREESTPAGSSSGESSSAVSSGVVSLSAHRRRRAVALLVAAAAIVVGGIVVAQQLPGPGSGSGAATDAGEAAANPRAPAAGGSDAAGGNVPAPSHGPDHPPSKLQDGRVVVRPEHFAADAAAAQRSFRSLRGTETPTSGGLNSSGCAVPAQHVTVIAATYRGAPAALIFQQPRGHSQVVDLYLCGTRRPIRSVTLPHP